MWCKIAWEHLGIFFFLDSFFPLGGNSSANFIEFRQTWATLQWLSYPDSLEIPFCTQGLKNGENSAKNINLWLHVEHRFSSSWKVVRKDQGCLHFVPGPSLYDESHRSLITTDFPSTGLHFSWLNPNPVPQWPPAALVWRVLSRMESLGGPASALPQSFLCFSVSHQ